MASPKLSQSSALTLWNGVKMPALGFGVYNSPISVCTRSCLTAMKVGYRHIDTAQLYGNEDEVGDALRSTKLPRRDLFVTTKIISAGVIEKKLNHSIEKIGVAEGGASPYVDAFLIHSPSMGKKSRQQVWTALEELLEAGRTRSIGVSNFGIKLIEEMKDYAKVWPPHINQLERELVTYCKENGIVIQAYSPIVRNRKANDPTLSKVAEQYSKSTAQVLIRYSLQKGWAPVPKSDTPERIEANADVFDFELSETDMELLDDLDQGAQGAIVMVGKDS
ncbi:MAG: hypothetical protein M1814_003221 [Vezdaea aestivalis]|nr:MAG: hypothetical protein M1814_003221 [Vezdaea aestivalis]